MFLCQKVPNMGQRYEKHLKVVKKKGRTLYFNTHKTFFETPLTENARDVSKKAINTRVTFRLYFHPMMSASNLQEHAQYLV